MPRAAAVPGAVRAARAAPRRAAVRRAASPRRRAGSLRPHRPAARRRPRVRPSGVRGRARRHLCADHGRAAFRRRHVRAPRLGVGGHGRLDDHDLGARCEPVGRADRDAAGRFARILQRDPGSRILANSPTGQRGERRTSGRDRRWSSRDGELRSGRSRSGWSWRGWSIGRGGWRPPADRRAPRATQPRDQQHRHAQHLPRLLTPSRTRMGRRPFLDPPSETWLKGRPPQGHASQAGRDQSRRIRMRA
jgi:hypothetical protein